MCRRLFIVALTVVFLFIACCVFLAEKHPALAPTPEVTQKDVNSAQERIAVDLKPEPVVSNGVNVSRASITAQPAEPNDQRSIAGSASVKLSASDINVLLAGDHQVSDALAQQGVSNVQIAFLQPDIVTAFGVIDRNGANQSVTVGGSLVPDGSGGLTFNPNRLTLGALPVPESTVDDMVRHESAKLLQSGLSKLPIKVENVSVVNGDLLLTGPRKAP